MKALVEIGAAVEGEDASVPPSTIAPPVDLTPAGSTSVVEVSCPEAYCDMAPGQPPSEIQVASAFHAADNARVVCLQTLHVLPLRGRADGDCPLGDNALESLAEI